ncbi:ABC transporter permease [Nitratireductor indicus]|uniref:Binding-protein-dependent transporters inner membrane component n=1 Tax=Nitratireductor indicus C115 TaxID=1231190 RepID=K2N6Q2_9HYPH|nr:ABC transporter permease [Nitratireductor indicus]EKF43153.1 binding-protein-dependent transporters inner membrane component [Nitratireductor indicus C115]MDS1137708.1 ABC transporter permease [Nitratireductor indicus]
MSQTASAMVPAQSGTRARLMAAFGGSYFSSVLIGTVAVLLLLGLWEAALRYFEVPVWLAPKPSDFLVRLYTDRALIAGHAFWTSLTIVEGFTLGVLVAIPLALAIVSVGALERGLYPVIVFLNIMPKTVIGPILIIWFGIGPLVAALIVFLMSFFPVLVDSMSGFRLVDRRLFYISRSMGANPWQTFWKVRLPAAMPHIFSGMKIGVVKAVEGVIIAEFIASNKGLGFMIVRASAFMDMTLMFSGLVAAAIVALMFNGAMSIIGQWLMPWSRH